LAHSFIPLGAPFLPRLGLCCSFTNLSFRLSGHEVCYPPFPYLSFYFSDNIPFFRLPRRAFVTGIFPARSRPLCTFLNFSPFPLLFFSPFFRLAMALFTNDFFLLGSGLITSAIAPAQVGPLGPLYSTTLYGSTEPHLSPVSR